MAGTHLRVGQAEQQVILQLANLGLVAHHLLLEGPALLLQLRLLLQGRCTACSALHAGPVERVQLVMQWLGWTVDPVHWCTHKEKHASKTTVNAVTLAVLRCFGALMMCRRLMRPQPHTQLHEDPSAYC